MRHQPALDRAAALDIATRSLREVGFPDADRVSALADEAVAQALGSPSSVQASSRSSARE